MMKKTYKLKIFYPSSNKWGTNQFYTKEIKAVYYSINNGVYEFMVDGKKVVARYSYVFKNINNRMRIVNHHSSELVEL